MAIKKTLRNIVLSGALALGLAGCNDHPEYHYNGKVGEENVSFTEEKLENLYYLNVERIDGTKVKYKAYNPSGKDLKLTYVEITKGGETNIYKNNIVGKEIIEEAQKQFDDYLAKILEIKQTKGFEDISK